MSESLGTAPMQPTPLDENQPSRREYVRLRLAIAIPVLMVLLPLILGVLHYRFIESLLDAATAESRVFINVEMTAVRIYISTFLICAVSLLFGLGLSWTISEPIRRLIRTTQEIATGDLSRTAPTNSGDEFGALGSSFNQMIASLNRMITERNRYILECYTGGLLILDAEGRILAANTSAEQILGLSAETLTSRSIRKVLARYGGTEPFLRIIENALAHGAFTSSREIAIQLSGARDFPLVVTTSPLRNVGGGRSGVVVNFRDLSQIKAFYSRMTRADRLAAVGTLAAGVAHEIRNPLASIKGLAQMLTEEHDGELDLPGQTHRYAEVIVREVNRLDGVVGELLEFAQADTQETKLWNLNQILREALEVAKWKVPEERRLGVGVKEDYGEIPALPLAAERVNRAFLNLFVNAFEACAPEGLVLVTSAFEQTDPADGGAVVVRIENSGDPIPPETIDRIFEPFFSTKPTGTGLGLPIACQVISSHGGTIDVESAADRTVFTVRFPLKSSASNIRPFETAAPARPVQNQPIS